MLRSNIIACGVLLVGAVASSSAFATGVVNAARLSSRSEQAHEFFARAQAAFASRDFEQARGLFLQAWSIQQSPTIALGLGQTEAELRRYRDCAEHLDIALRALPTTVSESERTLAKKNLAEAKAQVAVVQATTNRPGAEIRVDGRVVGIAPLSGPLYLDPGSHDISAQLDSNSITRPVIVSAGQEYALNLPLISQNRNLGPRRNRSNALDSDSEAQNATIGRTSSRNAIPVLVGGALFAAGFTTAIVFRLNSDSQFDKAQSLRNQLTGTNCIGTAAKSDACAALAAAAESGDRSRNLSTVGFAVAGVALAGTLAYWFWPSSGEKATTSALSCIHIGPSLSDHGSGLVMSGTY
jgi:hypothetical protein